MNKLKKIVVSEFSDSFYFERGSKDESGVNLSRDIKGLKDVDDYEKDYQYLSQLETVNFSCIKSIFQDLGLTISTMEMFSSYIYIVTKIPTVTFTINFDTDSYDYTVSYDYSEYCTSRCKVRQVRKTFESIEAIKEFNWQEVLKSLYQELENKDYVWYVEGRNTEELRWKLNG